MKRSIQPHERLLALAAAAGATISWSIDGTAIVEGEGAADLSIAKRAAEQVGGSVMFNRATPSGSVYIVTHDDGAIASMVRVDDRDQGIRLQIATVQDKAHIDAILDELYREALLDEVEALSKRTVSLLEGVSLGGRHRLKTVLHREIKKFIVIDGRDA